MPQKPAKPALQLEFLAPDTTPPPVATPQPERRTRAPQRSRQPVWTKLKPTKAYLLEDTDARLTTACESHGIGLQDVFEAAINSYCDTLNPPIPEQMPEDSDLSVPRDPDFVPGVSRDRTTRQVVVRLTSNTKARLVAGCKQERLGGTDFANDALNHYFDQLGIPDATAE
jgi:hypothetical protein